MYLFLFDIDGTLISAGGAGTRSLNLAFKEILDINDAFKNFEMAGKTDVQIIKEGLIKQGVNPTPLMIKKLIKSYIKNLSVEINTNSKHLKKGVPQALNFIKNELGYPTGLLTGNIEIGARIKLEAFSLNHFFPFGAFGSDNEDRNHLLPIAKERFFRIYKRKISSDQCIIVGDTPRDVECAKLHGAKVIAVATGPYKEEELKETESDIVIKDLTQIKESLKFLI